jgi:hypothetical protein
MKKEIIIQLNKTFEGSAYTQNGVEYWMARDMQKLLDYTEWRNFLLVVDKAKIACMNSGQNISDHFVDVNKMIPMPKGAEKDIKEIRGLLGKRGIKPEALPPEEDIKKLQRRLKSEGKKIAKGQGA